MGDGEALEVVIFRGFSSSLTHPTAFDPDQPLLPSEATINSAVLLQAPLNPAAEQVLAGPRPAARFPRSRPLGLRAQAPIAATQRPADLRVPGLVPMSVS